MNHERLADHVVLGMLADHLSHAMGGAPWQVNESMAKGPGSLGVVLGEDHTGDPRHLDVDFILNVDRPEDTTIRDCVAAWGATTEEAIEQAIQIWLGTTGSALLELLVQDGSMAAHFAPDDPDGLPGWHVIHGGVTGWGTGEGHDIVQQWAAENLLLPRLAPVLAGTFPRDHLVGIKAFFGGGGGAGGDSETSEIRVNGVVHEPASRALADLHWPRPATGFSYARTFMLLVHNEAGD